MGDVVGVGDWDGLGDALGLGVGGSVGGGGVGSRVGSGEGAALSPGSGVGGVSVGGASVGSGSVGGGSVGAGVSHFFSFPTPGFSQESPGAPTAVGRKVKAWSRANETTSAANKPLESVVNDPPRFKLPVLSPAPGRPRLGMLW